MNIYFNLPFYPIYDSYCTTKVLTFRKLKSPFFQIKNETLRTTLISYHLMWESVFKPVIWLNYKKAPVYKSKRSQKNWLFFIKNEKKFATYTRLLKNNYLIYCFLNNMRKTASAVPLAYAKLPLDFKKLSTFCLNVYKRAFGEGFVYIRGLAIMFFVDACVTDDEPLWEPIEWSLVQTWILFIFIFAWIAENLITSRYGSYTGRDKRVWFAWYKTFWLIELSYMISYALAALLVIVPFYYELTYSVSFIFSWWNWYTRAFFFKFISTYTIILLVSNLLLLNIRWLNWKKLTLLILVINFFIAYLLYTHFIMAFFGYFTDPLWYQKTRFIDYIQLSHEPLKWGWGPAKRDHFTYHKVSTVFWFKNDGPFAGAFLMFHMFFFLSIFFLYIYWLTLLRRIYQTKEITYTFTTFCVSALKQFYYFFLILYLLIFMSFIVSYWRFPIEFLWMVNSNSWVLNFLIILKDYAFFVKNIL